MHLTPIIIATVVAAFLIWLMGALWRRYYGPSTASLTDDEALGRLDDLLAQLDFMPLRARPLFRSRTLWTHHDRASMRLELEFCDGDGVDYTRLHCTFEQSLGQGVEILCEDSAGWMGWFLSMHEAEIGDPEFDEKFILMAKDDARLKSLLESPARIMIESLRDRGEDFQLTDQGFFVRVDEMVMGGKLERLLEDVLILGDELVRWAEELGPIAALQTTQYQDALAEMDMYSVRGEDGDERQDTEPVDMIDSATILEATVESNEMSEDSSKGGEEE